MERSKPHLDRSSHIKLIDDCFLFFSTEDIFESPSIELTQKQSDCQPQPLLS